jgi:hypothetical protein
VADAMQAMTMAASTDMPSIRVCVFVGESVLESWGGGGLECCFESGESFFEDTGDSEQSEQGGFGDVAALMRVSEQRCAQE